MHNCAGLNEQQEIKLTWKEIAVSREECLCVARLGDESSQGSLHVAALRCRLLSHRLVVVVVRFEGLLGGE